MFYYEATTLPTRANPNARPLVSGRASNSGEARNLLARSLQGTGIAAQLATNIANNTQGTWSDFPEAGVTSRIYEG